MKRQVFSYLAVAVIALLTALTSCDKNDDLDKNDYPVYVGVKLLDTETSGLYHSRKFIYDNHNRMKEIQTFSGGILHYKTILTYTGEDLTKCEYVYFDGGVELPDRSIRNYVKKGNTISYSMGVEILEGEGAGNQDFNITITLNNDGFPEKLEEVLFNTTSVSTFTYVNGNLTKHLYDTVFSSLLNDPGEKNYTYGVERSVFSGCNTPKWFLFLNYFEMASHNVVTSSSFPNSTSYSYEFDSDGFPTKIFQGAGDITEYKYKN